MNPTLSLVILVPLIWIAVSLLAALLSGWLKLSAHYRTDRAPQGRSSGYINATLGFVGYRRSLRIHTDADGLFLTVMAPFRVGHPPLFIPWRNVREAKLEKFLWKETIKVTLGDKPGVSLKVPKAVFDGVTAVQVQSAP